MPAPTKNPPRLEDFKAPWELDSDGDEIPEDEQELDRDKLKRYILNLLTDKGRLQAKVETLTSERDDLQGKIAEKEREGESEADRLKRENQELKDKVANASKTDVRTLRLEAALEAGLPREFIKRLDPDLTDLDELIEDAKTLKASLAGKPKDEDDDDSDDEPLPTKRPRTAGRTNGDPAGRQRTNEVSVDDLLDKVNPSSSVFR